MELFWIVVVIIVVILIAAAGSGSGGTNTQTGTDNTVKEIDFYDSLNLHPEKEFRCKTTNGDIYSINLLHSERVLVIVNVTMKNVIKLNYRDILKCDVQQDNSTITESSAGAALTGLLFFGVEGAIVGASSKSSKDVCSNLSIRIITNEILNPNIIIPLIQSSINRQSAAYRNLIQFADDVYSTIMAIIGDNNQQQTITPAYNMLSQPMNSIGAPALGMPVLPYQNQIRQQYENQFVLYDVVIKDAGERKIDTIKVIRNLTSLGLVEAKEIADNPGRKIISNVSKQYADHAQSLFNNAGAVVDIIPSQNSISNNQSIQFIPDQNVQVPFNGQAIKQSAFVNDFSNLGGSTPSSSQDNYLVKGSQEFQGNSFGENTRPVIPDLSAQTPTQNYGNFPVRRAPGFLWNSSDNTPSNQTNNNQ